MEKEMFFKFAASYFYKKGFEDAKLDSKIKPESKNLSDYLNDCKKAYKQEIDENRKSNPHHHLNRMD
jgi:hypothetical protein